MISSNLRSQSMYSDNNIRFFTTCKNWSYLGQSHKLKQEIHRSCNSIGSRTKITFRSPPALERHKNIPRQRTQGAKTVFSLFFPRNTYDKTIWVDKDYVHETHYEKEDPYGNLEFWIWHVCNLLRNISTVEPHGAFNGTTLKLKQDLIETTWHAYRGIKWGNKI